MFIRQCIAILIFICITPGKWMDTPRFAMAAERYTIPQHPCLFPFVCVGICSEQQHTCTYCVSIHAPRSDSDRSSRRELIELHTDVYVPYNLSHVAHHVHHTPSAAARERWALRLLLLLAPVSRGAPPETCAPPWPGSPISSRWGGWERRQVQRTHASLLHGRAMLESSCSLDVHLNVCASKLCVCVCACACACACV